MDDEATAGERGSSMSDPLPKRRWLRFAFSLRTLFVVFTVLGLVIGWLSTEVKTVRRRQETKDWLGSRNSFWKAFDDQSIIPIWRRLMGDTAWELVALHPLNGLPPRTPRMEVEDLQEMFPETTISVFADSEPRKNLPRRQKKKPRVSNKSGPNPGVANFLFPTT